MTSIVDKNVMNFACEQLRKAMSNPIAINRYMLLKKIEHVQLNTWATCERRK